MANVPLLSHLPLAGIGCGGACRADKSPPCQMAYFADTV